MDEGCPKVSLSMLSGIGASGSGAELGEPQDLALFDDNDPPKIMVIGDTPMGGLIILDTAPGEGRGTIFYKEPFGGFYHLANGIEDFFALLRKPSWK
jgi:hypothetical protein